MTAVYLDTGLFIALAFTDDDYHARAIELVLELIGGAHGKPIQTCSAVIIETAALIHCKCKGTGNEQRASQKVSKIFSFIKGYKIEIKTLTSGLIEDARRLYEQRQGSLDLVDCINVVTLRTYGANKIASFDGDYDQFSGEGIIRLC